MATPAKKIKTDLTAAPKKLCPYGASCYRKNPAHFAEFSHPGDPDWTVSTSSPSDGVSTSSTPKTSVGVAAGLPPCKYGASCYRKNLLHFAEYSHPTSAPSTSKDRGDRDSSGADTEVYDSDDDRMVTN